MPWPAGLDDPERRPAVAVLVRDPEERAAVTRPDLIAYFGLTPLDRRRLVPKASDKPPVIGFPCVRLP